jgi:hypothetical protein
LTKMIVRGMLLIGVAVSVAEIWTISHIILCRKFPILINRIGGCRDECGVISRVACGIVTEYAANGMWSFRNECEMCFIYVNH